jgi:trk system potassium uptake protein TrkH
MATSSSSTLFAVWDESDPNRTPWSQMVGGCSLVRATLRHPARLVPSAFLGAIAAGTVLLMLPVSRAGDGSAPPLTALFTSTSAVCVTGLIVEDTPVYWSRFGQTVILGLFQVGGFGIMTGATLLGLLVTQRIRLRVRLVAQVKPRPLGSATSRVCSGSCCWRP